MKLHKIKYRNPALDTRDSYCINNYLWAKKKIQILNDKEFLAPKYYCPRHVGQTANRRAADTKYRARNPLKQIKAKHERKKHEFKEKRKQIQRAKHPEKTYCFKVMVTATEYKILWNFLYKDVRDPLKDRIRIQTIEELIEKEEKRLKENENE